ncbi:protein translocase subunit SecF [Gemmiger formicilis]|uniref:protein translocase subunit SecF n=1 Tax=Gemmiger formicilis TaxID=745368 RepID=UPI00210B0ADE|nr:protein translocase subunit SecF [Gemmiger formicilis]MCQ5078512.1 protein translocase subunit SecF [Gemmiger formicilis]MCQ5115053.1 protein translocase subunit SecF [Gemmiger formicilis]
MNRKGKSWPLFVVAILIVLFSLTTIFGVSYTYGDTKNVYIKGASDIRFGIDIRGGVDVTFMPADDVDATDEQLAAAKTVIEDRLVGLGITDYESYVDNNKDRIIVRFPWKSDEADFNPQTAIDEIGTTAKMVFRKGSSATGEEILSGDDVASASAAYNETEGWVVQLKFNSTGASAFADATTELAASNGTISIWLDDNNISTATVNEAITGGEAIIKGKFDQDSASTLANQINSGSLPFALSAESYSTISPTLGAKSLDVMVQAGIIAFLLVAVMMIVRYRLPGTIAVISLMGQVAATLAVVSGYFTVFPGSTLTLPGIAGIILGIGMGVDANVITAERIKEELSKNKTLEGAVKSGFKMGLTPIIDGNVTIVIVAAILMGAFGPTDGFWAKVFNPIFFWFGPSTAGTIYSFGFTLLTSVLLNFVFGVWATRVMIRGAVHFKPLRKAWLFGGKKEGGADFKTPSINFIGNRKKFYTFSCALIAIVLVFCGIFGVKMDVEFKGGSMVTLSYEGEADLNALKSTISTELNKSNLTLQTGSDISGSQTLTVTLPGSETLTTEQMNSLLTTLNEQYPANNFVQNEVNNVDATIGKEFLLKSIVALIAACVLILLYVAYRFRKIGGLKAGSTAIVALLHDMFVVFGVFVILRIPLNGNFIAALLTILGYSINDTVVIYDRIRENSALYSKKQMGLAELVNLSINQSFARSLMTSITTCLALGVVCVISVIYRLDSIYSFAFPLLFGMVSGVYSTICIATPLWVDWKSKKKAAKKA